MFKHTIRLTSIALAAVLLLGTAGVASAYVGASFVQIPGVDGGWKGEHYKSWFKVDGNYWPAPLGVLGGGNRAIRGMQRGSIYSGPGGPRQGAGTLVLAIDKDNPVLSQFMERCANKTSMAELRYAESSERSRTTFEIGARPATVPEYYEYKLKDVVFVDCPAVSDAPQQAIVVSYKDIERLNYAAKEDFVEARLEPVPVEPAPSGPKTRSFVLTWFALAHDVSNDQCPVMNTKPTEADYYALVSKEAADQERAQLASKGGVNYESGQMGLRGPGKLNVTMAPGIVRDPGNAEPQTKIARGLNLDGDDGNGAPLAGICKHKNYVAADGRTGIDNQLYTAQGCIQSYQGHKGFYMQFSNNQMRDGSLSMLVQITGIDSMKNDDSVEVRLIYSLDPMVKNAAGSQALPDYTYRLTSEPKYTHYFTRLHGRIVNGVLTTDTVKELHMNLGQYGTPANLKMFNAGIRLEFAADGTMKGVVGGYQDWRTIVSRVSSSAAEQVHNFQVPGMYNALKRDADGLKDPQSGQCNGISSAYDMEGIPAYIEPASPKAAEGRQVAAAGSERQKAR
jgi:hypothetical protein